MGGLTHGKESSHKRRTGALDRCTVNEFYVIILLAHGKMLPLASGIFTTHDACVARIEALYNVFPTMKHGAVCATIPMADLTDFMVVPEVQGEPAGN